MFVGQMVVVNTPFFGKTSKENYVHWQLLVNPGVIMV